jgi:hypothetical protein
MLASQLSQISHGASHVEPNRTWYGSGAHPAQPKASWKECVCAIVPVVGSYIIVLVVADAVLVSPISLVITHT